MGLAHDLRFACRSLAQRPGFALTGILTLALGIGANTAVFSVVNGILLRPLPVQEPERLVAVWEKNVPRNRDHNVVNPANLLEWRDRARSFEALSGFVGFGLNLSAADSEPERVHTGIVTDDFFRTLGVSPALGRGFQAADAEPGVEVAILSDGLWKRRFGGDPGVLGREILVQGEPTTIVGIMPPRFSIPPSAELWIPLTIRPETRQASGRYLSVIGRLAPGVTVGQAREEMIAVAARLEAEAPDRDAGWTATVDPLQADLVRGVRPAALLLFGAVGLVLLVACGNLANLLLARALEREREIAVRRALGAGQARLVAQLLTESLVLAVAGGALGVALAPSLVTALLATVPDSVRALFDVGVDARVLAFTLGLSSLSALLFGALPALSLARGSLSPALREGASGSGTSPRRRRLSQSLVAAEVALSVVLLVGGGLLLRSFERLSHVDPGFDASDVLTLEVSLSGSAYRDEAALTRYFGEAVDRIGALPGVRAAGAISWRPIGNGSATSFTVVDRPAPPAGQEPVAAVRIVTPGTFAALGVPLVRGRDFDAADAPDRPAVVIVTERLARDMWPGRDPLGRRIRMSWGHDIEAEVVGVAGDARLASLDTEPAATLYWPVSQLPNKFMTFVVRTAGDPWSVLPGVKARLAELDPGIPAARIDTLDAVVHDSLQEPRVVVGLVASFAAVAAALAAFGLVGLLACTVRQRRREIGVRLAIGARPADVLSLVLREGLRLGSIGVAFGLAAALTLSRSLASLLYEVSPQDPVAFGAVAAVVLVVSLLAALGPALRASRTDPCEALRAE